MKKKIADLVADKMAKDKNMDAEKLEQILEHLLTMGKNDIVTTYQIVEAHKSMEGSDFRQLGKYARDMSEKKAVRFPKIEFPWTKKSLIQLSRAIQNVNAYMYNLGSLSTQKQENLPKITAKFVEIEELAKDIAKMSTIKRNNTTISKPKNLKDAKSKSAGADSATGEADAK